MTLFHSIRTKLTLWYAVILGVTLIGSGITAYFITRSIFFDNLDRSLRNEVKWVNEFIEPRARKIRLKRAALRELEELKRSASLQQEDSETEGDAPDEERVQSDEMWNQIYQHTLLSPRRHFIQILDRNGDLLYRSQSLRGMSLANEDIPYQTITLVDARLSDGEAIRLAVTQNNYVKIFVAYPLAPVQETLDGIFYAVLFIAPIAILISIIGGWFLAHKSLKPVDDLTRAARDITAQNLNQRLPALRADDELSRLTGQFNDMIGRLQASFAQIQQFSADASHELRTPLTIMRGEIEVALRSGRISRPARVLLHSIHDEIVRLTTIVENLVFLTKSQTGRLAFRLEPVALHSLLRQLVEDARVLAEPGKIRVKSGRMDDVTLTGDESRLRQLFLNLLDNAVKYSRARGTVTVTLRKESSHAVARIRDTGIGIPRKDREKIFERFYRVERTHEFAGQPAPEGSGLGLSIAQWIADAHDGTIEVQSREGHGSTFIVTLPLDASSSG